MEDKNGDKNETRDQIEQPSQTPTNESEAFSAEATGTTGSLAEKPQPVQPPSAHKLKSKKRKVVLILLAILVIVTLIVAGLWYFIYRTTSSTASRKAASTSKKTVTDPFNEKDPQVLKFINPTTGETWLDKPVKIAKQGYLKNVSESDYDAGESTTDYYEVGARGKNKIIMTISPGVAGRENTFLYEKSEAGVVTYVNHPSNTTVYKDSSQGQSISPQYSADNIKSSNDIHYDSLSVPSQLKIDQKGSVVIAPDYDTLGYLYSAPKSSDKNNIKETLVRQLGKSAIYKHESTSSETGLTSVSYFIKTPINTQIDMGYEPLDLSLEGYKWESGVVDPTDSLKAVTHGCGLPMASVTRSDSISASGVKAVGKSAKGLTVYEFVDTNDPLLKKAYDEYYQSYNDSGYLQPVSKSEFINQHGVVLFKDVNNRWLVYVRTNLAPSGGCAKPVVYLYPQKTEVVTVKVGAHVKISDPFYDPKTGWTALVHPNGQLVVGGSTYDSLFWEGPGYGRYPEVTEGTVVKKGDAIPTIKSQLAQMGLTKKETSDFVAYWQDKLPNKPYIRLTWFNTQQMNQLAPLYISPKPDTMIRVFLDSAGLDKPIGIQKQTLKSVPRKGFTVVEWGGLSVKKLY